MKQIDAKDVRVLIVCPVRNERPYLDRLLKSLQSQTFGAWRAVFFDNGSTDGTLEFLESAAMTEPRITVFPAQFDLPIHQNFNRAFDFASKQSEPFFQFLAADDQISNSGYFDEAVAAMKKSDSDFAIGSVKHFDEHDVIGVDDFNSAISFSSDQKKRRFAASNYWVCNLLYGFYKRDFFLNILEHKAFAFTDNLSSDWWFSLAALTKGKGCYVSDLEYGKFRKNRPYSDSHYTLQESLSRPWAKWRHFLQAPFSIVGDRFGQIGLWLTAELIGLFYWASVKNVFHRSRAKYLST